MSVRLSALVLALLLGSAQSSLADTAYVANANETSFEMEQPRSTKQRIVIASLFGGAALVGAVGGLFALDSKSKSDEVSAVGSHSRMVYTRELEDTRRSAVRSRNVAVGALALSGSLVIAGIAAFIITAPEPEVVHVSNRAASAFVSPIEGGAMAVGTWSF